MSRPAPYLLTLVLLLSLGLVAQTAPQSSAPQQSAPSASAPGTTAEPNSRDQAHATLEQLGPDLNLTADQKAKLEPILTSEIQLMHDLRADTSMTPQQKSAKFRDALTADHAKIDAILTPEQKTKLSQMNQARQAQQSQQPAAPPQSQQPAAPPQSPK